MFFAPSVNFHTYTNSNMYLNDGSPKSPVFKYVGSLGVYQEVQGEPLGSGSYGEVRLVQEVSTMQLFAMKKISRSFIKEIQAEENIKLEIFIQSKLNHPNILKLIEVFGDQQNLYIVLEYCSNGNLTQLLKQKGPLKESEAFHYFYQILSGIEYLHQNNVLHRDIKPDNIIICGDDTIKICDYNWAIQLDANQSAKPVLCGTTEYMPPEVVMQQNQNYKLDVWSLGIVLYEMLHCNIPYKGRNNVEKINSIMANASFEMNANLSQDVQILIYAMLSRQQNLRPTTRQIFFSKWVKSQLIKNSISSPYDSDVSSPTHQISKSANISIVKGQVVYDIIHQRIQSDVKPVGMTQSLQSVTSSDRKSPIRIQGPSVPSSPLPRRKAFTLVNAAPKY